MGHDRGELHSILEEILGSDKVYFQPPESSKLSYPCIIYERDRIDAKCANNMPYTINKRYKITVIDSNPDSLIPDRMYRIPMCSFDRHYTSDRLNHDVFNLYY